MTVRILFTDLDLHQVRTLTTHLSKYCGIQSNSNTIRDSENSIAFTVGQHLKWIESCRESDGALWLSYYDDGKIVRGWTDAINIIRKIRRING